MAQLRVWDFGAPRKSEYLNDHFVHIVPTKRVYEGYSVRETSPASLDLDIKLDGAPSSVLMTEEGIRIEETADLLAAVTIVPDPAQDRIDFVVAAHQYSGSNNPQVYEVIQGIPGASPLPPAAVPQYKVLLATVYVPAGATAITDNLINQVRRVDLGGPIDRYDFLELRPDARQPATNSVFVNGGTYVNSTGVASVTVADDVASGVTFPAVTAAGQERIDLILMDNSGVASRVAGVEAVAGSAVPPSYPVTGQTIAEVTIDEDVTVQITPEDIRDVRFFFNLGSVAGVAGELVAVSASDTTPDYLGGKLVAGSGMSFVTLNPGGNEQIQINGSGGGSDIALIPEEIKDFILDDSDPNAAHNDVIWGLQPVVRFEPLADRWTYFNFDKRTELDNALNINFRVQFSLTSPAGPTDAVRLLLEWWVVNDGATPNIGVPTGSQTVDMGIGGSSGNVLNMSVASLLTIPSTDFAGTGTEQRIICRLTHMISGAAPVDYSAGAFDIVSLIPTLA